MINVRVNQEILSKLESKIKVLENIIEEVKKDFEEKGEEDPYIGSGVYFWRKSPLFDPDEYAKRINSSVRYQIGEILELLLDLFPWFSGKFESPTNYELVEVEKGEYCVFRENFLDINPVYRMIAFIKRLRDDEVIKELYKPVFVGLSIIMNFPKKEFQKSEFENILDRKIFESALNIAIQNGWISVEDNIYKIIMKPKIQISCPYCKKIVSANQEKCPFCGFYILNLALKDKKGTEEIIPKDFFEYDENVGWKIFFIFKTDIYDEIYVGYNGDLLEDLDVESHYIDGSSIVLDTLVKLGERKMISRLPDFIHLSELYTDFIPYTLLKSYSKWFLVVEAETLAVAKRKLGKIRDEILRNAVREYKREAELLDRPVSEQEFLNKFTYYLKDAFVPPLDEHPIWDVSEEEMGKTCPRCGTIMPFDALYCGKCGARLQDD